MLQEKSHIKSSKIKAFTLSEMIVVMLLTVIVVGITFSVLNLVQKQMYGIEVNLDKNNQIGLLEQSLWIDFNTYHQITYDEVNNSISFKNELDSIVYGIQKNQIVKLRDTFYLELAEIKVYFNGKETQDGVIDALYLETSKTFNNKKVFVYRKNDALQFLR